MSEAGEEGKEPFAQAAFGAVLRARLSDCVEGSRLF